VTVDRREKLLSGLDIKGMVGVEIGALCRPLVKRENGRVIYVDHADTATLKLKYQSDPGVSVDDIVDVDVVWGPVPLEECLAEKVDYVIASHVVEHVPDLISWLEELHSILKQGGELRLIVPDKRFTFDRLRRETVLTDVVYARSVKAKCPWPHIVLDYVANVSKVDGGEVWEGVVDDASLERHHSLQHAINCAMQAREGIYHDVHCWVFTPNSFALLFRELAAHDLIEFECARFHDTERGSIEFFVNLRPCGDHQRAAESWQQMALACTKSVV
jgi:predicted SAM-dependent methyltransferase